MFTRSMDSSFPPPNKQSIFSPHKTFRSLPLDVESSYNVDTPGMPQGEAEAALKEAVDN